MTKLYITLIAAALLLPGIPLAPLVAVSEASPLYTHFVYMFGHANLLHWVINAWALLMLHNILHPSRLVVAYMLAVMITGIPYVVPDVTSGSQGLVGLSVINCFFFGFILPHTIRTDKLSALMMTALMLVGFFIPGIAALPHVIMYVCGCAYFYIEGVIHSFIGLYNNK